MAIPIFLFSSQYIVLKSSRERMTHHCVFKDFKGRNANVTISARDDNCIDSYFLKKQKLTATEK